jgi:hypothetical protein
MEREATRRAARRAQEESGVFALSVFAALDETVEQLCTEDPDMPKYRQIRTSTCGQLRRSGFALLPTFDRPHFDIVLPDLDDATLERLEGCFAPPGPNPGHRPVRS